MSVIEGKFGLIFAFENFYDVALLVVVVVNSLTSWDSHVALIKSRHQNQ